MLRHELVEGLIEPTKGERMLFRERQHGRDRGRQAGNTAVAGTRRIHAIVDGADVGEERLETGGTRREETPEFAHVIAPVARHVEGETGEAVGVIEAPPVESSRHAEPLQDRGDGTAGPEPREVMRAGIEAVEAGRALVVRLAQEGMAKAAR